MRRRRGLLVVTLAGLVVLSGCTGGFSADEDDTVDVEGDLEIHHVDVGQADATLLVTPAGETVLIDTGDWRADGQAVIDYLEDRGVERIDHLVTTHPHADHIGGHAAVIEHFEERGEGVGAVYDPGVAHTSRTYENYLDAIEAHDVRLFQVAEGDTLPLDDDSVTANVLNPPEGDSGVDVDANSIALAVEFGGFTYLTTGDAERTAERRMVDEHGGDLDADVYQAGHHGSSTSSTDPFLEAVDPEIAVVSSALESQYGHPHDEVLEALADRGVETYWTGVHGDVVIRTDGEEVSVATEREGPTDPSALLERKREAQSESLTPRPPSGDGPRTGPRTPDSAAGSGPVVDGASPRTAGR